MFLAKIINLRED